MYSIIGLLFVGLSSIGNRQSGRAIGNSIVGCLFAFAIVATSFIDDSTVVWEEAAVTTQYLLVVGTICGWIVVLCHLHQIVGPLLKNKSFAQRIPFLQYLLTPGGDVAEARLKQAASHKVQDMIVNALDITRTNEGQDNVMDTYFGQALLAFSKLGKRLEPAGGLLWTWRRCISAELFKKEGIWFTTRLLANNFMQFVLCVFLLWSGIELVKHAEVHWRKEVVQADAVQGVGAILNAITSQLILAGQESPEFFGLGNNTSNNYSAVVSDFMAQQYLGSDFNCSLVDQSLLDSTSLLLDNYGCGDMNVSALSDQDLLAKKVQALQASGFDYDAMNKATTHLLQNAAENSVQALYPDDISM
jgi:hypothetical protein